MKNSLPFRHPLRFAAVLFAGVGLMVASLAAQATLQPVTAYNLRGFGQATTGGGVLAESDPNYRKVYTPADLHAALASSSVRVIEIMNDLNLGYLEIPSAIRTGSFTAATVPLLHPVLLASGVTRINLSNKSNLTLFSANGSTLRHAWFYFSNCSNIIIRNLRFDELWEWDESTKGDYDRNSWDFITLDSGSRNIWIDHCDFTKVYDGPVDIVNGSNNVTISWCRFLADDGGPDSFVRKQFVELEKNPSAYAMYGFLRSAGFSLDDIVAIARPQKKGHLVGGSSLVPSNANLSVTLHHNLYLNLQDRIPRLRAGNAHAYNIFADCREAYAAKLMRTARRNAMSSANQQTLATYKFDITSNGAISTEDGAVLVEKSVLLDILSPVRNNQTNPSDPAYTGKIQVLDTIYTLGNIYPFFRGDSDTPGGRLTPGPAAEKPFSFNGFSTLPYAYAPDDPTQLEAMLTGSGGAGAGQRTWSKENWLKTSYASTARMVNVSTRADGRNGEQMLIAGFVLEGTGSRPVLLRAVGPTLANYGVASPMSNPRLELFQGVQPLQSNEGWGSAVNANDIAATAASVGAFALPAGSLDAAILTHFAPGAYTAQISGVAGEGIVLGEIYDGTPDDLSVARVVNLSTRGLVEAGEGVLIAGFVINGNSPRRVLVRGIGPTLANYGVSNPLPDPMVSLMQGDTVLVQNADWDAAGAGPLVATTAAEVGAFALTAGSGDAALVTTLAPGVYTAIVQGRSSATGVALVEVYELPNP